MVKAWINNSLTREIAVGVLCLPTTQEVWKDINEKFGQSNGSRYIQIHREVSSITQGLYDIATYFTKMRTLWDELSSAYVGPPCICGSLFKFIDDQHLIPFLSAILMMSPLHSISKSYALF
ncbi:hypothetical protein K7X08_030771 [Anisodus acutangulus]|uniref:Retrotransposon gag domain-containing protein n=1 Tax=Anisodus acutangulus TaxID=402998 RepID=A0A9Q1M4M7_9SOLA|nr:hypothetical protein K7X08_030771 [Anisodus acutangulus]